MRISSKSKTAQVPLGRLRPALREGRAMFQVKHRHTIFLFTALGILPSSALFAQGYDDAFEMKNKLKVELQYADYGEYEYPEPIIYRYGVNDYRQLEPFIANFPEKRALVKFTRMVAEKSALGIRYQYSELKKDAQQHYLEAKITQTITDGTSCLASVQFLRDSRGYSAFQGGMGSLWEINALTSIQGDIQYFYRGPEAAIVGGRMGTFNARMKFRQVLTLSTALQFEYSFYDAKGEGLKFDSHTAGLWLSQFLPTQTAVHLNVRYYTNTMGITSLAPSIEIAQYIDWATTLWLKYRYYKNKSDNVSLGEQSIVVPDGLRSSSGSIQLNREMSQGLLLYMKYRYYSSNLHVQMNTYMIGFVYSF